jgi:hypothetical protein
MLSLSRCKEILGINAKGLSDEEILNIRDGLYELARVTLEITAEKIKMGNYQPPSINKSSWT